MAIISSKPYYVSGLELRFQKVIKYHSRIHRFEIQLPPEIATVLGIKEVIGETEEKVDRALEAAIEGYKIANLKTRKVILYKFRVTTIDVEGNLRDLIVSDLVGRGDSVDIELKAGVYLERELAPLGRQAHPQYTYELQASSIPISRLIGSYPQSQKFSQQVDWTEAREKLFADLVTNLADMGIELWQGVSRI